VAVAGTTADSETLRLVGASSNNFPPVNLLEEGGELTGFGRDMARAVVGAVGGSMTHIHSPIWTNVLKWLADGEADFIHDTGYTPERTQSLDYSEPILKMPEEIFVRSHRFDIQSLDSLAGKRVACVNRHITHLYLMKFPRIQCVVVKTPPDAVRALFDGTVDAVIYPRQIVLYYAYQLGLADGIKTVGEPLRTLTWHMVVKRGNARVLLLLNQGIAKVKASGEYERIYDKWFGRALPKVYPEEKILWIVGIILAVIVLLAIAVLVWLSVLRREVRRRTTELRQSEERYRGVVDFAPNAIVVHDGSHIIFANEAAARLHGASTPDDLVDRHWLDLIHPDERERAIERNEKFMSEWIPAPPIIRNRLRLDGSEIQVETAATPIMWDGKPAILGMFRDISEQVAAEKALRSSEERFRDVAEIATDWIWETGPDLRFSWVSSRIYELLGRTPEEFIGKTARDLGPPDNHSDEWSNVLESFEAHRPFTGITYSRTFNSGEQRHITVSGKPLFDADGGFLGYRGVGRDITGEVEAKDQATRVREQFLRAVENISDSVALFDTEERLVFSNHAFRKGLGDAADTVVPGMTYEQTLRERIKFDEVPDAGKGHEEEWVTERLADFRAARGATTFERDGRWAEIRAERLPDGGTILRISNFTDRMRAENVNRRLAAIVGASADAIIGTTIEGILTEWNKGAEELYGYTASEAIGQPIYIIAPDDTLDEAHKNSLIVKQGGRVDNMETVRRRQDGTLIDISLTISPIRDATGHIVGLSDCRPSTATSRSARRRKQS